MPHPMVTIRYTIHRKAGQSRIRKNGGVQYAGRQRKPMQKAGIDPAEIAGVGIDGQSWSAIAIDQRGQSTYQHTDLDGYPSAGYL